ncbi:hypothetical protein QJQ45_026296 [Haematococcus lacustris]|nr:hypothetical protein QJQ45_026296 [Haematococcus lacustris]
MANMATSRNNPRWWALPANNTSGARSSDSDSSRSHQQQHSPALMRQYHLPHQPSRQRVVRQRQNQTDKLSGKVATVNEFRTSRVSSAMNSPQLCEAEMDRSKLTRPTSKPQPGQVQHRLFRSVWSKRSEAPVRGLMWCPKLDQATPGDIGKWVDRDCNAASTSSALGRPHGFHWSYAVCCRTVLASALTLVCDGNSVGRSTALLLGCGASGNRLAQQLWDYGEWREHQHEHYELLIIPKSSRSEMSFTEVQLDHALTLQPISTKRRAVSLVEQPSATRPRIEAGPLQPSLHHEAGAALETPAISLRNEGLPGQLKSICVVNFMCHAHFALEFGPHVTLVSGTNGSGKSAVIQGLQVCLGLKARETRRGDNLQSFIKTGCEEAKVQVTLWNKGDDAYEPAIFGEQITIERRLTRKASNPFKLVDERNKTVSVSRSSIDAVLEYFNINAANPLTIVTQDMARDFNSGGSADRQKKYTMYMEGTLLFDIQKELNDAAAELGKVKETVDELSHDKDKANAEVQEMTGKRELCEGLEKQRDIQAALENHMAWLEAYAARSTVQQLQQELDQKLPEQLQQLNQLEAEVQAKLETIKQDIHTKMEAAEQAQETISRHRAQIQDLSEQARLAGRERLAAQREVDDCKTTVAEVEQELQALDAELTQATSDTGDARMVAAREELAEFTALLTQYTQDLEQLDSKFDEERQRKHALDKEKEEAGVRRDKAQQAVQNSYYQLDKLERQLRETAAAANNAVMRFGGNPVMQLMQTITTCRQRFQHPPIGPLGLHIKLADARWAVAVEVAVGSLLNRFICHTNKDAATLRDFARQVSIAHKEGFRHPSHLVWLFVLLPAGYNMQHFTIAVTTPGLPRHNVPRKTPQGVPTVMDMLQFTCDPSTADVIFNYLVDTGRIESTVLAENGEQGRDVVYKGVFGPGMSAIDIQGTNFRVNGSTKTSRVNNNVMARLGVDNTQAEQKAMAMLTEEQQRYDSLRAEADQARARFAQLEAEVKRVDATCVSLQQQKNRLKKQMEELRNKCMAAQLKAEGNGELATKAAVTTQRIQGVQMEKADAQAALRGARQRLEDAARKEKELKMEYAEKMQQWNSMTNVDLGTSEVDALVLLEQQTTQRLHQVVQQLAVVKARVPAVQQELEAARNDLVTKLAFAQKFCEEAELEKYQAMAEQYLRGLPQLPCQPLRRKGHARNTQDQGGVHGGAAEDAAVAAVMSNPAALEKVVVKLQQHIEREESNAGGDLDSLEKEENRLQKIYLKKLRAFNNAEQVWNTLRARYRPRMAKYQATERSTEDAVNNLFFKYMHRRAYLGQLKVNHDTRELTIYFQKNANDKQTKPITDLKQCSGGCQTCMWQESIRGERSYITVSFLLALSHCTESPFSVLDEYDVYMDPSNRRVATETLLEFALNHPRKQFVLLTPQASRPSHAGTSHSCMSLSCILCPSSSCSGCASRGGCQADLGGEVKAGQEAVNAASSIPQGGADPPCSLNRCVGEVVHMTRSCSYSSGGGGNKGQAMPRPRLLLSAVDRYQAQPVSDVVTVFYKKTGSVVRSVSRTTVLFGTEVTLPATSLLGPELSIRQPAALGAAPTEYYELEIKMLKPSTAYVVKIKSEGPGEGGEGLAVRSERLLTLSVEEERNRDIEMAAFAGSLIKLGDYDATVLNFAASTGLYSVRVLQVDDVAAATQLVRFTSDYTELGLAVRAYTLSSVKFGRWGGEISGSRVVAEGELRWIVARAVELEDRSRLEDGYSAQSRLLEAEAARLTQQLEQQRLTAASALRLTRLTYLTLTALMALLTLAAFATTAWLLARSHRVNAATRQAAATQLLSLQQQLDTLQLYRVSLELDSGAWMRAAAQQLPEGPARPASTTSSTSSSTSGSSGLQHGSRQRSSEGQAGPGSRHPGAAPAAAFPTARHVNHSATLALLGPEGQGGAALAAALRHSIRPHAPQPSNLTGPGAGPGGAAEVRAEARVGQGAGAASTWGGGSSAGGWAEWDAGAGVGPLPDQPPHPWTFVQAASSLYATYLQEWIKLKMAESIQVRVAALMTESSSETAPASPAAHPRPPKEERRATTSDERQRDGGAQWRQGHAADGVDAVPDALSDSERRLVDPKRASRHGRVRVKRLQGAALERREAFAGQTNRDRRQGQKDVRIRDSLGRQTSKRRPQRDHDAEYIDDYYYDA